MALAWTLSRPPRRRSLLADLIEVIGGDDKAHSDVLCSRLAAAWPDVYGGWRPKQLAIALKPHVTTRRVWANSAADGVGRNRRGVVRADLYAAASLLDSSPSQPVSPVLLNVDEAAEYLGISRRTLERIAAASGITYVRSSGRRRGFRIADLDAYLTSRTVVARNTA